jgi:AAA domain-containing protein
VTSTSKAPTRTVLSLAELLADHPAPPPCLIEPGLLPSQGILFIGGEPKAGKSLLVANLALALAAGCDHAGFTVPSPKRVLICQFELPTPQFALRLATMRKPIGDRADSNLFVDTRVSGHLLSSTAGVNHFLSSARSAQADVIVIDPLYSTHDQDENDTRAMAALCQSLIRLRDASNAALIVVHHVRKAAGRYEIGSAFRGSSALHAVGDSYMLLARPSPQIPSVELRFQFRYAAAPPSRLLSLDPTSLWFSASGSVAPAPLPPRLKVEPSDVQIALKTTGSPSAFNPLRQQIIQNSKCSKRTADLAIRRARDQGFILHDGTQYRLPL